MQNISSVYTCIGTWLLLGIGYFPLFAQEPHTAPTEIPAPVPQATTNKDLTPKGEEHEKEVPENKKEPVSDTTIAFPIQYSAEDSIVFDIKNTTIYLYGSTHIQYDTTELSAEEAFFNWSNYTACTSTKGNKEKKPVLKLKQGTYTAEKIRYNFSSRQATANQVTNQKDGAYLRTEKIKKESRDIFYADQVTYTTCDCNPPHFHIGAQHVKVTGEDQIVSGSFHLYFHNTPTPFGFFSGLFYFPRQSGILFPTYGGESGKGFCMKGLGGYIRFNDYIDLRLQGDIYSCGISYWSGFSRYKKRYRYRGNFSYGTSTYLWENHRQHRDSFSTDWRLRWAHSTENRTTSSLVANIDLHGKPLEPNPHQKMRRGNSEMESSVLYNNNLVGLPYKLSTQFKHFKRFPSRKEKHDAKEEATLPTTSLRTGDIYPFRNIGKTDSWYRNIHFSHTFSLQHRISSPNPEENLFFSKDLYSLLEDSKRSASHSIPLATNFKLFGYIHIKPSITCYADWSWNKPKQHVHKPQHSPQRPFQQKIYHSATTRITTNLYGTHFFGGNRKIQAIRHHIAPSFTFHFQSLYYHIENAILQKKTGVSTNRGLIDNDLFSSATMRISLDNTLEMKLKTDDEKNPTQKIPILESLSFYTDYNFLKEKYPLGDFSINARTKIFKDLFNIDFDTTLDPYIEKTKTLAWKRGEGWGHVKNASLGISTHLSPHTLSSSTDTDHGEKDDWEEEGQNDSYEEKKTDFTIPWETDLSYYCTYQKEFTTKKIKKKAITKHTLKFSGGLALTEKWKISLPYTAMELA